MKTGDLIKIPCTLAEISNIKHIFKTSSDQRPQVIEGCAFVVFGELSFFVSIGSTDITAFKNAVLGRIASYFYPLFDQQHLSLEKFEDYEFKVIKQTYKAVLSTTKDLEAAMRYFNFKLDVIVEQKPKDKK